MSYPVYPELAGLVGSRVPDYRGMFHSSIINHLSLYYTIEDKRGYVKKYIIRQIRSSVSGTVFSVYVIGYSDVHLIVIYI